MFTLLGLVIVFTAILGGYVWAGGPLHVLVQPAGLAIIGGAAVGTLLMAAPGKMRGRRPRHRHYHGLARRDAEGDRPQRWRGAGRDLPRHPPLLRRLPAGRDHNRAAGARQRALPALHQGGRGRLAARHAPHVGGRVRPPRDLHRRAADGGRDRRRLPRRQKRARVTTFKRRPLRPHHYGAAWKVAYADFTTAMMALFVVLWLLTQADVRLRQQIAQYFRQPGVLPGGAVISPYANELYSRTPKVVTRELLVAQGQGEQELLENEKKAIDQALMRRPELALLRDQVIVQLTDAGLSIQVVDRGHGLLFDLSSARLKPALVSLLKQLGHQLGRLPNRIQIGGHTDSRPFPPEVAMTNWDLAFARANNARRVLEASGLWAGQIHRVVGYADSEPLVPEDPLADENRRLSILAERNDPLPGGPIALPPDKLPGRAG